MHRRFLNGKIHRATVTDANLNYVGSLSLDPLLMSAAGIAENEQVAVLNIANGERFETYVLTGDSGQVCLNGAAARLAHPGDLVIIVSYADLTETEVHAHRPTVVHVDEKNRITTVNQ